LTNADQNGFSIIVKAGSHLNSHRQVLARCMVGVDYLSAGGDAFRARTCQTTTIVHLAVGQRVHLRDVSHADQVFYLNDIGYNYWGLVRLSATPSWPKATAFVKNNFICQMRIENYHDSIFISVSDSTWLKNVRMNAWLELDTCCVQLVIARISLPNCTMSTILHVIDTQAKSGILPLSTVPQLCEQSSVRPISCCFFDLFAQTVATRSALINATYISV
jgi:hypothetical protein